MAVIVGGQLARLTAGHDDEDELMLLARLGHPDNARALAGALVNHAHGAVALVEIDAGVQIGHVQSQVGEGRAHAALLR